MSPSPLWYTTRGLGLVLLIAASAVVVLGIATTRRWKTEGWPAFLTAGLHRNLSLLVVALLPLHALAAVLDPFAHLGLVDVSVPFATAYRPLWLGLGVLAGELVIAVTLVSLVRGWLGFGLWKLTHWTAYAAWPLAVLHGLGTGSDTKQGWVLVIYAVCVGAALLAMLVRLLSGGRIGGWRAPGAVAAIAGFAALVVWTASGPLQPGWAAAAGTPKDLLPGSAQHAAAPAAGAGQAGGRAS